MRCKLCDLFDQFFDLFNFFFGFCFKIRIDFGLLELQIGSTPIIQFDQREVEFDFGKVQIGKVATNEPFGQSVQS